MRLALLLTMAALTACNTPRDRVVLPPLPVWEEDAASRNAAPEPNPVFVKPMTPKP